MPKWLAFDKLSLRRELISLMLLCSSVALILSCMVTYFGSSYFINRALSDNHLKITARLANSAQGAIISNDTAKMSAAFNLIATFPEVNFACLYSDNYQAIASTGFRSGAATGFNSKLSQCPPFTQSTIPYYQGDQLHAFAPVKDQNIVIGGVYVRSDDEQRQKYNTQLKIIIGCKFILITFIVYLIARYLQGTISKPLTELNDILSSIIQQRVYTSQFYFERDDEIGALANRIKKLLQNLSKAHTEIKNSSYTDSITNLPNKRFFLNDLKKHLSTIKRTKKPLTVLVIHVEGLSDIYQNFNEQTADSAWNNIALRLQECIRSEQVIARLSENYFATVQPNASELWRIRVFCHRILSCFTDKINCEGKTITLKASIGIATTINPKQNPSSLLELAEKSAEKAQKEGSNSILFHDAAAQKETVELQAITSEFARLNQKDKIAIYAMPIFKLDNQKASGLDLIPYVTTVGKPPYNCLNKALLCEDKPTIDFYHKWLFKHFKSQLQLHGALLYSEVDIITLKTSIKHIYTESFIETMQSLGNLLEGFGVKFCIAITEKEGLALDPMHKNLLARELKSSNVAFALDIAYNSALPVLNELHDLPIKLLRFNLNSSNIENSSNIDRLFNTITLKMAQLKGMHCLALHVKTPKQLQMFTQSRCTYGQGPLLSQAMALDQLQTLLSQPLKINRTKRS